MRRIGDLFFFHLSFLFKLLRRSYTNELPLLFERAESFSLSLELVAGYKKKEKMI